jgi:hypothetical protein
MQHSFTSGGTGIISKIVIHQGAKTTLRSISEFDLTVR